MRSFQSSRRLWWSWLILLSMFPIVSPRSAAQQAKSLENAIVDDEDSPLTIPAKPTPTLPTGLKAGWSPVNKDKAQVVNAKAAPARVRIGLRLTPFRKVAVKDPRGAEPSFRFVPADPLRHTLKARLNMPNHFFVGEWHIETHPLKWVRRTQRYEVRLSVYRRFGAFGQLEENVGSLDLAGTLSEDDKANNVHVLIGVARRRLRDKFGAPVLDIVAGFQPGTTTAPGPALSQGERAPTSVREAPPEYSGELLRGRF